MMDYLYFTLKLVGLLLGGSLALVVSLEYLTGMTSFYETNPSAFIIMAVWFPALMIWAEILKLNNKKESTKYV